MTLQSVQDYCEFIFLYSTLKYVCTLLSRLVRQVCRARGGAGANRGATLSGNELSTAFDSGFWGSHDNGEFHRLFSHNQFFDKSIPFFHCSRSFLNTPGVISLSLNCINKAQTIRLLLSLGPCSLTLNINFKLTKLQNNNLP